MSAKAKDATDELKLPAAAIIAVIVFGILAHVGGFALVQVMPPRHEAPEPTPPLLAYAPDALRGNLIGELALLSDTEPLILPTRWNASVQRQRSIKLEPTGFFAPFPAEILLTQMSAPGLPPTLVTQPMPPRQTLRLSTSWMLSRFDAPKTITPLPSRVAALQVRGADHALLITQTLDWDDFPVEPDELWQPAIFHWNVATEGVLGLPLLEESSGNRELDRYLQQRLSRLPTLRQLPAGYYKVTFGP